MDVFQDLSGINELGILDLPEPSEVESINENGIKYYFSPNPNAIS